MQFGVFLVVVLTVLGFRGEWHNAMAMSSGLSMKSLSEERDQDIKSKTSNSHDYHVKESDDTIPQSTQEDAFQPENLLLSERVPCGANKCFFRLKSDPNIGYLVAPSIRLSKEQAETDWFKTLEASWQLAEYLVREYEIKQFLLEAPRNITITSDLATHLNQNLWLESKARMQKSERFPEGSTAFIQKVQTAPTPNLLVGCAPSKVRQFRRQVDEFIPSIKRKKRFARRFTKYMRQARELLEQEPCLMKDFQVLLDIKGRFYHLDLDRCFMPGDVGTKRVISQDVADSCFEALEEIESHVRQALFE